MTHLLFAFIAVVPRKGRKGENCNLLTDHLKSWNWYLWFDMRDLSAAICSILAKPPTNHTDQCKYRTNFILAWFAQLDVLQTTELNPQLWGPSPKGCMSSTELPYGMHNLGLWQLPLEPMASLNRITAAVPHQGSSYCVQWSHRSEGSNGHGVCVLAIDQLPWPLTKNLKYPYIPYCYVP